MVCDSTWLGRKRNIVIPAGGSGLLNLKEPEFECGLGGELTK
jgi:hypothetical protein